jgi:hypothetical protein
MIPILKRESEAELKAPAGAFFIGRTQDCKMQEISQFTKGRDMGNLPNLLGERHIKMSAGESFSLQGGDLSIPYNEKKEFSARGRGFANI